MPSYKNIQDMERDRFVKVRSVASFIVASVLSLITKQLLGPGLYDIYFGVSGQHQIVALLFQSHVSNLKRIGFQMGAGVIVNFTLVYIALLCTHIFIL